MGNVSIDAASLVCIALTWGSAKSATTSTTFIPVAFVNGS